MARLAAQLDFFHQPLGAELPQRLLLVFQVQVWKVLEELIEFLQEQEEQYRLGKSFCDRVVELTDEATLSRMWESSEALPSMPELEEPRKNFRKSGATFLLYKKCRAESVGAVPKKSGAAAPDV